MISRKTYIEAVTVCINYADYFEEVIPHNLHQIDQWHVVTTPDDKATIALCRKYDLKCLKTECMYLDAEKPRFNKSRAINYGLAHHSCKGWMLHLDADIALPPQFRRMIESKRLHEDTIYGMDRFDCHGAAKWDQYRMNPQQYDQQCLVYPPGYMKPAARIAHGDYGGYCPIGFMQMWNPKGSGIDRYPVKIDSDMEHTDVLHAIAFPDDKRVLLAEGYCIHIISDGAFGVNWQGRKSPPFRSPVAAASPADPNATPAGASRCDPIRPDRGYPGA